MSTICIKIGGSTVDAEGLLSELSQGIKMLPDGSFPVIVHGGGKDIARLLKLLNKEGVFVDGFRVTDAEMVKIVQMVLSGDVNKRIVNTLLCHGVNAFGFSGVDSGLFEASRMTINGKDIGYVGNIDKVKTGIIDICRLNNLIPVISPISRDNSGNLYNVNADLAAGELAMALKADDLIYISDVDGVLIEGKVRSEIHIDQIETLIEQKHITGGMIPKMRSAADAVSRGVSRVHICGWHGSNTLKNELSTSTSTGTVIFK